MLENEIKVEEKEINAINFASGETISYGKNGLKLEWSFLKQKGKTNNFITMSRELQANYNGKLKKLTLTLSLSQEELETIAFFSNVDLMNDLPLDKERKLPVMTRFIYGKSETGDMYLMCIVNIANNHVNKRIKLSYNQNSMINAALKAGTPFDFFADERSYEEVTSDAADAI